LDEVFEPKENCGVYTNKPSIIACVDLNQYGSVLANNKAKIHIDIGSSVNKEKLVK